MFISKIEIGEKKKTQTPIIIMELNINAECERILLIFGFIKSRAAQKIKCKLFTISFDKKYYRQNAQKLKGLSLQMAKIKAQFNKHILIEIYNCILW